MNTTAHFPQARFPKAACSRLMLCSATLLWLTLTPHVHAEQAPAAPQIEAKAFILMDYHSGVVLAEQRADERLDPASLTKMMASYVIGQAIKTEKLNPTIWLPSVKMPGQRVTLRYEDRR